VRQGQLGGCEPRRQRRAHFAACNGTAPIEVSSGQRKIYRLSRRRNRRLNHAIHMAAVTQIRYRHAQMIGAGVNAREPKALYLMRLTLCLH
jgi:Transposase IS116/IS110/IS902 family